MVEVRDAATVMLVRDGDAGMEVLMLMRNLNSDFVGGAYVFPGGAVDPHDRHQDLDPYCLGRTDEQASERLGIESGGLAFWVAAVRECFEEAGILLAYTADGEMVSLDDPEVESRFVAHRAAIDQKKRRLIEVCAEEDLKLAVDEGCARLLTVSRAAKRMQLRLTASDEGLEAVVTIDAEVGPWPPPNIEETFSWRVLSARVDTVALDLDGGAPSVRMTKSRLDPHVPSEAP